MNCTILNLNNATSDSIPDFDLSCKFVLIQNESEVYLVFGALSEYKYHANLAAKFCDLNSVSYHWVKKPDLIEILDGDYKIKGGGMMRLSANSKKLEVGGYSTAYGKYDSMLLKKILDDLPVFKGYQVIIGT